MSFEIKDRWTERVLYSSGANLTGANLTGANLTGANLTPFQRDLENVLFATPGEILGLRKACIEGMIDGSTYSSSCGQGCLVGTIAIVRGCTYDAIPGLQPDASRPIKRYFADIRPGHTPENSERCAQVVRWIDEFTDKLVNGAAIFKATQYYAAPLAIIQNPSECKPVAVKKSAPKKAVKKAAPKPTKKKNVTRTKSR